MREETDLGHQLALHRRRRLVQLAVAYAEANARPRVTVTELCQALDVSRRTLEYAFREVLRTSPKAFFVRRALDGAHQRLRSSSAAESTVTDVATEFGFWHLGRFSGSYRVAFGETPSETLRRTA